MSILKTFGVSKNGFLPENIPSRFIKNQTTATTIINEISQELPKLMLTNKLRSKIDALSSNQLDLNIKNFNNDELSLLFSQLSFLSHAYILGDESPSSKLPASLSTPWVQISKHFQRPPVLSYSSYCLSNWYKIDINQDIGLDNIALINNFLGGIDEDWFVTIHVCIENAAGPAINSAYKIISDNLFRDEDKLIHHLNRIYKSLIDINEIFRLMPEKCDPYIYYHRVRPYIFGWKNNPDLPNGIIYEGHYDNKPQKFRGETGAQSSIIPTFDALFAVNHERDELKDYLDEMRLYMPKKHRSFIEYIESNTEFDGEESSSKIVSIRDKCLDQMTIFRSQHLQYASDYIHKQNVKSTLFGSGGSVIRGTGGTPFMKYLRKHRDETDKSKRK